MGRLAFHSLVFVIWILGACSAVTVPQQPLKETGTSLSSHEPTLSICAPCSRDQAEAWERDAERDAWSALRAANCYLFLVTRQTERELKLSDARKGRELAKRAVARYPRSGLAHYLYAYLTGLVAENDPLRGLELVPVIEQEARSASTLNPSIDKGGPDRMLGELYLKAPAFPVSIGDAEKSVAAYQKAVDIAPEHTENRLGLADALLQLGEREAACGQLHRALRAMPPADSTRVAWQHALDLLNRLCTAKGSEQ